MSSTTTITVRVEDGKEHLDISKRNRRTVQLKNPKPNRKAFNAKTIYGQSIRRAVHYRFDTDVEYFRIELTTGEVYVKAKIPPVDLYELPIVIYDKQLPFIMIKMEVIVFVQ